MQLKFLNVNGAVCNVWCDHLRNRSVESSSIQIRSQCIGNPHFIFEFLDFC